MTETDGDDAGTYETGWVEGDPKIVYCPRCGEEVEPLWGLTNPEQTKMLVECPNHGECWVSYEE